MRFTSGATPADLLAASMAAELISFKYLRANNGGDKSFLTLLPTVSIMWAAFSVSSLHCSISIRDLAMSCCIFACARIGFPKATLLPVCNIDIKTTSIKQPLLIYDQCYYNSITFVCRVSLKLLLMFVETFRNIGGSKGDEEEGARDVPLVQLI